MSIYYITAIDFDVVLISVISNNNIMVLINILYYLDNKNNNITFVFI